MRQPGLLGRNGLRRNPRELQRSIQRIAGRGHQMRMGAVRNPRRHVERKTANRAGTDVIRARAKRGDTTCVGVIRY